MSRWIPHTYACSQIMREPLNRLFLFCRCQIDRFAYICREGSCLIWACYQQHCHCSSLIRKGKQIRVSLDESVSLVIRCRSYYACVHATAVASSLSMSGAGMLWLHWLYFWSSLIYRWLRLIISMCLSQVQLCFCVCLLFWGQNCPWMFAKYDKTSLWERPQIARHLCFEAFQLLSGFMRENHC